MDFHHILGSIWAAVAGLGVALVGINLVVFFVMRMRRRASQILNESRF